MSTTPTPPLTEEQIAAHRAAEAKRKADEQRKNDPFYSPRMQSFEVVMIKKDKHEASALPEDFKRVAVSAESTYTALNDEAVTKEADYRPLFAATPGALTDVEILARQRELNMGQQEQRNPLDGPAPRR